MEFSVKKRLGAEFIGTALLLATVVGSGIMAETLAGGNIAVALLGNTIATGAILYVLITMFAPVSGAHFNPAVTLGFWLNKDIKTGEAVLFVITQIIAAIFGVWLAHAMFDVSIIQTSPKIRAGLGQGLSETVATFGLMLSIFLAVKFKPSAVAATVGLYITAAYWFTASTSFANPAVTIARSLSNSFAGIRPLDAPVFIIAQLIGAVLAYLVFRFFDKA